MPQPPTILDIGAPREPVTIGEPTAETGRIAHDCIERAVRAVQAGEADAIVTAPISKEALHLAGKPFPGHTELLTALTGGNSAVMMLAHGPFRVSHLTTHIPLEAVPARLTPERLRRVVDLTREALSGWVCPTRGSPSRRSTPMPAKAGSSDARISTSRRP